MREEHAAPAGSIFVQTGAKEIFIRNVSILSCEFLRFSLSLKKHSSGWVAEALLLSRQQVALWLCEGRRSQTQETFAMVQ